MDSRTFQVTDRNGLAASSTDYTKTLIEPISLDNYSSPAFYAELWGLSYSTILRWFHDYVERSR